jgi:hypothetical protein
MLACEIDAWTCHARPAAVDAVAADAVAVMADWTERVSGDDEREHLRPWCRCGVIFPIKSATAAAQAAVELAIVADAWPRTVDQVLRAHSSR